MMNIGSAGIGLKLSLLMFNLGFGYILCYLAKKSEDKGIGNLGHVIGMIIITLSSALILFNIWVGGNRFLRCGGFSGYEMKYGMPRPGMMHRQMMMQQQQQQQLPEQK